MTLAVNAYCQIKATASQVVGSGNEIFTDDSDASPMAFADGVGNGQAQKMYEAKSTSIAASGTLNLDLNGALTDVLGAALNLTKVKAIYIEADPSNQADITVGPGASNPFNGPFAGTNPTVAVQPGGKMLLLAPNTGWTVTPATGDILKIVNASASQAALVTIKIVGI